VFGFSIDSADVARGWAVMRATARVDLVLHERRDGVDEPARRWGFVVADLDRAREAVWDLGVQIARDSGAPDHIYWWSNRRSLYIRDRDANDIELVEVWSYARRLQRPALVAGA
jgi:hypothetical protein